MIKIEITFTGEPSKDAAQIVQARGVIHLLQTVFGDSLGNPQALIIQPNAALTEALKNTTASTNRIEVLQDTPVITDASQVFGAAGTGDDDADEGGEASSATVDNTGLPWDARIHSTPGKLNADGTWRAKRGVAASLVDSVTKELRGAAPAATPTPAPAPPSPPAPPAPPSPPTPPAPVPDGGLSAQATDGGLSFGQMMAAVGVKQKAGLSPEDLTAACKALGYNSVLNFSPANVPGVARQALVDLLG